MQKCGEHSSKVAVTYLQRSFVVHPFFLSKTIWIMLIACISIVPLVYEKVSDEIEKVVLDGKATQTPNWMQHSFVAEEPASTYRIEVSDRE